MYRYVNNHSLRVDGISNKIFMVMMMRKVDDARMTVSCLTEAQAPYTCKHVHKELKARKALIISKVL